MRNKIYLIITLLVILCIDLSIHAQFIICNTPTPNKDPFTIPYYGNSEFFEEVERIIGQLKQYQKDASIDDLLNEGALFDLPVKIWLYFDDNGTSYPAMTEAQVLDLIDNVNERLENTNADIQIYLKCEIEHVASTFYNREMDSFEDISSMFATHKDGKAINIHIARYYPNLGGQSRFPGDPNDFSLVVFSHPESYLTIDNISEILVHEFGHVLDLRHTFHCDRCTQESNCKDTWNAFLWGLPCYNSYARNCFQESVSRGRTNEIGCVSTWGELKCEINGDYLCSTEAVPEPIGPYVTSCVYSASWIKDNWDDEFVPQEDNYMVYNDFGCINTFTDEQISIMWTSIMINMYQSVGSGYYEFWYNGDILSASGLIEDEESEEILISGDITIPTDGSTFGCESGSETLIQAQNSIVLDYGFSVDLGAYLTASVGEIEDNKCTSVDFLITNDIQKDYSDDLNLNDQKARLMLKTTLELETLIDNTLRKQQKKKEYIKELEKIWLIDSSLVIAAYEPDKTAEEIVKSLQGSISGFSDEILVFPNPVQSELSIAIRQNDDFKDLRVIIYDQIGIIRYTNDYNTSNRICINLSALRSGVYWYLIETTNNTFSGKFVKN